MADTTFEWPRASAFFLLLLPVLVENVRSGRLTNAHSAMVFLGGVALLVADRVVVDPSAEIPWGLWAAVILLVILSAVMGALPGGVAKFLIAVLPWFTGWEPYLWTAMAAFFLTAAIGYFRGGQAPFVPGFYLAGLGAFVYAAA